MEAVEHGAAEGRLAQLAGSGAGADTARAEDTVWLVEKQIDEFLCRWQHNPAATYEESLLCTGKCEG